MPKITNKMAVEAINSSEVRKESVKPDFSKSDSYISPSNEAVSSITSNSRLGYRFVKRSFDILISLIGLILLSPLFLVISAVIFFSDGRPIFHHRKCVNKNGYYDMLKFRTMKRDADNFEKYLNKEQMEIYLRDCKLDDDPRITKTGKFLRKTSLDELPQLVNVLKGEMSLVGPRPVIEREAAEYGKDREKLLSCRPGITGYWQVYGRGMDSFIDEKARRMQLYYIDYQSISLDIKLLFKTVAMVFSGRGAK